VSDALVTFSLSDHLGRYAVGFEWLVSIIELFAILILVLGLLRFAASFANGEVMQRGAMDRTHAINTGRIELARHILAALEVFIVSDIIRTVLDLTMENLILLGVLVAIRTVISLVLDWEMRVLQQEESTERERSGGP
jgi:uncharacterized membrane protein